MNTPGTSLHPGAHDPHEVALRIANLRAKCRRQKEGELGGTSTATMVQDVKGAVTHALSPGGNTDNGKTQIQSGVDTDIDSDLENEGGLDIDFDDLEIQSKRTVEEVFGASNMENSSIQSIDRTKLMKGITIIETVSQNGKERFTLVFSRLSHSRDIATKEQFLKFENETHEYIWNGIIKGQRAIWGMRLKGSDKKYLPVHGINAEKVTYE